MSLLLLPKAVMLKVLHQTNSTAEELTVETNYTNQVTPLPALNSNKSTTW